MFGIFFLPCSCSDSESTDLHSRLDSLLKKEHRETNSELETTLEVVVGSRSAVKRRKDSFSRSEPISFVYPEFTHNWVRKIDCKRGCHASKSHGLKERRFHGFGRHGASVCKGRQQE